jgi:cation diffusion facilitator family transporter
VQVRDYAGIRRVLILTMVLNWVATAGKLYVGLRTGTLSLSADGFDSLFDGLSNLVGLAALTIAARPPDREHPYGHRKYETFVALGIAMMLAVTTWELAQGAIERFAHPLLPQVTIWSFAAALFGIAIQASASAYEIRVGRRLKSEMLIADATHSGANVGVSVAVLCALPFVQAGYSWVDPALTLIVAGVIAKLGFDILSQSMGVLVDRAAIDPALIAGVLDSVPGVTSYHRIRSRGTPDEAAVDLHMRVGPELPVARATAIADEVRDRLLREVDGVTDVTVHVEPQEQSEPNAAQVYTSVQEVASGRPITVHEMWVTRESDGQMRAEAHIGVAPNLSLRDADEEVSRLETHVLATVPGLVSFHTHIEPAIRQLIAATQLSTEELTRLRELLADSISELPELSALSNVGGYHTREGLYVSLDCIAQPELPVTEVHALAHALAASLRKRLPDVLDVAVRIRPAA